jgi:uncharacterized protein (TIGR00375 family)
MLMEKGSFESNQKNLQKFPDPIFKNEVCSELFSNSKFLGSSKRLHSSPFLKMESSGFDDNGITKDLLIADLHVHSRFARATSKDLTLQNLVKFARIKGVGLLGTGDFTHPKWSQELNALEERDGILYLDNFPFLWQTEISLMYTKNGKGRRVHYLIFAPGKEVAKRITEFLGKKGRLDYDGRPIFGFQSTELVDAMEAIDDKIEIIPAHAYTPWFGIFGSSTGYDSLKEAFDEKASRIHAVETGMSSDPAMNWRIKELENKSIVSFSDLHSFWPWRIGREATIFHADAGFSYNSILKQIRENSFKGTVETDPAYGKYHYDGHRGCNFSSSPAESKRLNGICPVCKKPLTIGVEYRVEQLAANPVGYKPSNAKPFYKILPMHELISLATGVSLSSKRNWKIYNELIEKFGNEFNILLNVKKEELGKVLKDNLLIDLIMKNRAGGIKVKPGYDGNYGVAMLSEQQKTLF